MTVIQPKIEESQVSDTNQNLPLNLPKPNNRSNIKKKKQNPNEVSGK